MSDVITSLMIQIKADATSALAAFKNIVTGTQQVEQSAAAAAPALATVTQQVEEAGVVAQKTGGHIAGMSYYFRSFFDSMRFAMLGNPMAAFYMVDEGVRALVASGMGLMPIAGIIGTIGAVVGGSFIWWEEFGDHIDKDAKKAEALAKALDKIPEAVKRAYQAQQLGAITEEERKKYESYLSGKQPMLVANADPNSLGLIAAPDFGAHPKGGFNPLANAMGQTGPMGPMLPQGSGMHAATHQQVIDFVNQQIDKKMAENAKTVAKNEVANTDKEMDTKAQKEADTKARLANEAARTQEQTLARLQRQRQQELREIEQQAQKQKEADKQHEEDLQRQAQLTRDIQRSAIENQIESVKSNALMTDQQKLQIVSALQAKQEQINNAEIAELTALKAQVKSVSDQLELEKKIAELKGQNQKISDQTTPAQQSSFGFQFSKVFTGQQDKWTGWAQESADSFSKAWNGATSSVSGGLTHLFEYGAQKGQWFREMWNGVIGSMISSATNLAVEWVSQHIIMQGISTAFHAVENALTAQSVAAHAIGEQTKTASTAAGATERGAIRMIETVMHNVLVALRVAAHVAGEALSTAATAVGAAARAIYHAIAAAVGAMESEASVPYVGVILGIAAGAAIMAAAYGMMGGFAAGGYTGDGHPSQIAGIVHAGEYVTPANRTSGAMNLLRAIHSGALSDSSAPQASAMTPPVARTGSEAGAGQVQHVTHIGIYHDRAKMAQELQQSDAHEKWTADIATKAVSKMRS